MQETLHLLERQDLLLVVDGLLVEAAVVDIVLLLALEALVVVQMVEDQVLLMQLLTLEGAVVEQITPTQLMVVMVDLVLLLFDIPLDK